MHTRQMTAPLELGRDNVIHFGDDLAAAPVPIDPSFWTHEGPGQPELAVGRILGVSDYTATGSWWERHPVGDELVFLLSGQVDFLLSDDNCLETVVLAPGQAAVVPAGTWHRAVIRVPSRLLFVTPTPARTELRDVTPSEALLTSGE